MCPSRQAEVSKRQRHQMAELLACLVFACREGSEELEGFYATRVQVMFSSALTDLEAALTELESYRNNR